MCHTKVAWTLIEGLGGYAEASQIMRATLAIAARVLPREGGKRAAVSALEAAAPTVSKRRMQPWQ